MSSMFSSFSRGQFDSGNLKELAVGGSEPALTACRVIEGEAAGLLSCIHRERINSRSETGNGFLLLTEKRPHEITGKP